MMGFYDFMGHKPETQAIIDTHANDFNADTAEAYLKARGGVKEYIRSLGGVFTKYVDFTGKIGSYEQLNEIGDYVTGLYDIWGVDYSNGCNYTFSENRYKAYDGAKGAFYPRESPKARFNMNYATFGFSNESWLPMVEEMLEKGYIITNCAQGVVQILKKAGLVPGNYPDPAYRPSYYTSHGISYKLIKSMKDLRPGDVLLLAHGSIPNRSTRTTLGDWESWLFHTTIVAETTSSYIITYDTGHAYTYYGQPRNKRPISGKPYEWCDDWIGMRLSVTANLNKDEYWYQKGGKWYYIRKGVKLKGWQKLDWSGGKNWFYFGDDGAMVTGWKKLTWSGGEDWFYFDGNGCMVTGWKQITYKGVKRWFYFESTGAMVTGLRQLKYKDKWNWYLFDADGVMQTGTKEVTCTFGKNGLSGGKL